MGVTEQLLNAQDHKPCMGVIQDSLFGASGLSKNSVFLTKVQFMDLMMNLEENNPVLLPVPAILKPEPLWTGKQALSLILPRITLRMKSKDGKEDLCIRNGELLSGTLNKKSLGPTSGGIIHTTCKLISSARAIDFLGECQKLVNAWLEHQGASVGLDDCMCDDQTAIQIEAAIKSTLTHVEQLESLGKELRIPFALREQTSTRNLNQVLSTCGGILQKALRPNNTLSLMVEAQSKGTTMNIAQIIGTVSQQCVDGSRIYNKDDPNERTLACFPINDTSVASRGFVSTPYIKGLSPAAAYFHNWYPQCPRFFRYEVFCVQWMWGGEGVWTSVQIFRGEGGKRCVFLCGRGTRCIDTAPFCFSLCFFELTENKKKRMFCRFGMFGWILCLLRVFFFCFFFL
jgi:DNA-directed RNA polymerase II subunit RPB1